MGDDYKGYWFNHKRFNNRAFKGSYERDKKGERIFILTNKKKRITFESWQMAKKTGWRLNK